MSLSSIAMRGSEGWGHRTMASLSLIGLVLTSAPSVFAEEGLAQRAREALTSGRYDEAIVLHEKLADQRVQDPSISYNRGLAYLRRVQADKEQAGDLGQAATAFEEAARMAPESSEAALALDQVRKEIARRRAHASGATQMDVKPSFDRLLIGILSEATWAWLSMVASLVLTTSIVARRKVGGAWGIYVMVALPLGLIGTLAFGGAAWWSMHLRQTRFDAVAIVSSATVLTEQGTPQGGVVPLAEGTRVEILSRKGELLQFRYGTLEGWVRSSNFRELSIPATARR